MPQLIIVTMIRGFGSRQRPDNPLIAYTFHIWYCLTEARGLPEQILRMAVSADILRKGPQGSMWAAHADNEGALTGWEEGGPQWRGFASGGSKSLFGLGSPGGVRVCVTEAAIDVMSIASLEGMRGDSLYVSAAGDWSPVTKRSLRDKVGLRRLQLSCQRPDCGNRQSADSGGQAQRMDLRHVRRDEGPRRRGLYGHLY